MNPTMESLLLDEMRKAEGDTGQFRVQVEFRRNYGKSIYLLSYQQYNSDGYITVDGTAIHYDVTDSTLWVVPVDERPEPLRSMVAAACATARAIQVGFGTPGSEPTTRPERKVYTVS
jgi:hypothetical protein